MITFAFVLAPVLKVFDAEHIILEVPNYALQLLAERLLRFFAGFCARHNVRRAPEYCNSYNEDTRQKDTTTQHTKKGQNGKQTGAP